MSVVEQKKGGRYTQKEREERRLAVFHLHFEENKPATEIADIVGVNRITIGEDIKFWYSKFANTIGTEDITKKITLQILRKENQRDRLLESLEECETLDEKIRIERFIAEIDRALENITLKIVQNNIKMTSIKKLPPEIDIPQVMISEKNQEEENKKFLIDLIKSDDDPKSMNIYTEDYIAFEYINKTKCDTDESENLLDGMREDGLGFCKVSGPNYKIKSLSNDRSTAYDIGKYLILRGYMTKEEIESIHQERLNINSTKFEEKNEGFKN